MAHLRFLIGAGRPRRRFYPRFATAFEGNDSRRKTGVGAPARRDDARDVVLPGKEVAVKWLGKVHVAVLVPEKQYIDPARQQIHQISAVFEPVGEPLFDP